MSAAQPVPVATPAVSPSVPTSPEADAVVALSHGLAQLVAFVKANPQVLVWFQQQFGTRVANAAHTTAGSLVGAVLGWTFAHFGIQANPSLTLTLCGTGVLCGSLTWNGILTIWRGVFKMRPSAVALPAIVPVAPPTAQEIAIAVVAEIRRRIPADNPANPSA